DAAREAQAAPVAATRSGVRFRHGASHNRTSSASPRPSAGQACDMLRGYSMAALFEDVKYAFRSLKRSPVFAATAVLSLGLAIGADTAVFSVVDALLLRPLPYAAPARLVTVRSYLSYTETTDLRDQSKTLESIGAYGNMPLDL